MTAWLESGMLAGVFLQVSPEMSNIWQPSVRDGLCSSTPRKPIPQQVVVVSHQMAPHQQPPYSIFNDQSAQVVWDQQNLLSHTQLLMMHCSYYYYSGCLNSMNCSIFSFLVFNLHHVLVTEGVPTVDKCDMVCLQLIWNYHEICTFEMVTWP